MNLEVRDILQRLPFRVSVTDYCNVRCFFCSNEGMVDEKRGTKHMDRIDFNYLAEVLVRNGLTNLSMTGGDPTLHPEIEQLVEDTEKLRVPVRFFHTNGIALTPPLIKLLSGFSKVAVSIHSGNYETWPASMSAKRPF
ncbi:MAG: radical SAM protein [DPANN group archaeon]|nr:radical SAM protein [DPANN group archaeon]